MIALRHCKQKREWTDGLPSSSSLFRLITSKPFVSDLLEIHRVYSFLALDLYFCRVLWCAHIEEEYGAKTASGLLSARALLRAVMLRRSKADVESELSLPAWTQEDVYVTLSPMELQNYKLALKHFLTSVRRLKDAKEGKLLKVSSRQGQRDSTFGYGRGPTGMLPVGETNSALNSGVHWMNVERASDAMMALSLLTRSTCHPKMGKFDSYGISVASDGFSTQEIMRQLILEHLSGWERCQRKMLVNKALVAIFEVLLRNGYYEVRNTNAKEPSSFNMIERSIQEVLDEVRKYARAAAITDAIAALQRVYTRDGAVDVDRLQEMEGIEEARWKDKEETMQRLIQERENELRELELLEQHQQGKGKGKVLGRSGGDNNGLSSKHGASRVIRGMPKLSESEKIERNDARVRWRLWKMIQLSCHELVLHLLQRLPQPQNDREPKEKHEVPAPGRTAQPSSKASHKRASISIAQPSSSDQRSISTDLQIPAPFSSLRPVSMVRDRLNDNDETLKRVQEAIDQTKKHLDLCPEHLVDDDENENPYIGGNCMGRSALRKSRAVARAEVFEFDRMRMFNYNEELTGAISFSGNLKDACLAPLIIMNRLQSDCNSLEQEAMQHWRYLQFALGVYLTMVSAERNTCANKDGQTNQKDHDGNGNNNKTSDNDTVRQDKILTCPIW